MDRAAWKARYASQALLQGAEPKCFVAEELRDHETLLAVARPSQDTRIIALSW